MGVARITTCQRALEEHKTLLIDVAKGVDLPSALMSVIR
jgi:hypothetical protein